MIAENGIKNRISYLLYPYRWLAVLIIGNIALISLYILVTSPWYESTLQTRKSLEQEVQKIRGEVSKVEANLDLIREKRPSYEKLLQNGWLAQQDRLEAAELIEELSESYHLAYLDYQFQPENRFTLNDPKLRDTTFVETNIHLTFQATLDFDVQSMISKLQTELPGAVDVTSVEFGRHKALELSDLLALEAGQSVALIEGSAVLAWRTLELEGVEPIEKSFSPNEETPIGETTDQHEAKAQNKNS